MGTGVQGGDFLPRLVWVWAAVLAACALIPLSAAWKLAPDLGHGWAAAILMAFLWFERWAARPRLAPVNPGWAGWLLLIAAAGVIVPLRLLLTPYPLWPGALLAYLAALLLLLACGVWLMAGGAGLRWVAAPLIVLLGAVPWPGLIDRGIILPMREGMAVIVAEISNLLGHPALVSGTAIQLPGGWVGIDEACGGIRSLQAGVMVALFFGAWLRLGFGRRTALIGIAAAAAAGGNFLRVLFLTWQATKREGNLAEWHDPAGWVALGLSLGLTGWMGWSWRDKRSTPPPAPPARTPPASLRPICGWMVLSLLLLGGTETGVRLWYARGDAIMTGQVPRWTARFPTHTATYRALPLGKPAREMLRPDHFEAGQWIGHDLRARSVYYVEWSKGQVARSVPFLHNPAVCLPYAGCELVRKLDDVHLTWQGGTMPFHVFLFKRTNEDLLVAFTIWDPSRGRELQDMDAGGRSWWSRQWRDVREARENQPAQLLAFAVTGGETMDELEEDLAGMVQPVHGQ